jgi:hypothetical protein
MRFPADPKDSYGLLIEVEGARPINEQLVDKAVQFFGKENVRRHVQIEQSYSCEAALPDGKSITVYVATVAGRHRLASKEWPTMPELLKNMPKDRNRLAYLKAWQILSGVAQELIKAVELEDL